MTMTIDRDAALRGLLGMKVPRAKAERRIAELYGEEPHAPEPERPSVFRITLPWDMLVTDNVKHANYSGKEDHVRYSRARDAVKAYGRLAAGLAAPIFTTPVQLTALVWVPDRRKRDVKNFSKVVEDSLEGAAYLNDAQVKRSTWEEAGMDAKYPRAEIEVTPYTGER